MSSSRPESLSIIEPGEAWGRLESSTVGMIAFVHDGEQHQMAVNYTVIDQVLYFRTSLDSTLATLADGHNDVAFTVLHRASGFTQGWNVTLRGRTETVDDPRDRDAVIDASGLAPWGDGDRDLLVALYPRRIDGRQAVMRSS